MDEKINQTQIIGVDLGRGYVKAYSNFNGERSCKFKSVVGQGRDIDFKDYENPIYIEVDGEDYFCGVLAEKEGDNITQNSKDDKTSKTAKKLLYAALNEIAVVPNVKIVLGVPYKMFRKSTVEEVKNSYLDKSIKILNKITGATKTITISAITIFRESDAALIYEVDRNPRKNELKDKVLGMVTVGFRTTEKTYFDKGMKFIDSKSATLEKGNRTVLEYVRKKIEKEDGISKELNEIDSSSDYDKLKSIGYENLIESIDNDIETTWINWKAMEIFIAGGTTEKIEDIPDKFIRVKDPQMITAKGLNLVGERMFTNG